MKYETVGRIAYPSTEYQTEVSVNLKDEHHGKHYLKNAIEEMFVCCLATNRMPTIGDAYITDDDSAEYSIIKVYPGKYCFVVVLELTEILK